MKFYRVSAAIIFLGCLVLLQASCLQPTEKKQAVERAKEITPETATSTLFLDSLAVEKFLADKAKPDTIRQMIRNFYNSRNFSYAWFDTSGIAEQAAQLWNLQSNYLQYSRDSSIYNPYLQKWADTVYASGPKSIPAAERQKLELEMTDQFFLYANKAYVGNTQLKSTDLGWYIPRRKVDVLALLDTLVKDRGKGYTGYEPVNRQYGLLREALQRYYLIQQKGAWDQLKTTAKKISQGDTGQAILQLKNRLFLTADLVRNDSLPVFDSSLTRAVKNFQYRYGLKEDGVVGGSTLREMNRPIGYRIEQILVNMERIRWVPAEPKTDYILVNIPEFRLHAYEQGKLVFDMNVVVGTSSNSTVIFTGNLKNVVFSPYWYVPPGILNKEVLPGIKKNKNYLANHNMEWNGGSVRQKPGIKNSLGLVKFLFPNNYHIYLHDTPSKSLFNESKRDFSHGCIRLGEPKKLAEWILRNDANWTTQRMEKAMSSGKEQFVLVNQELPVFIGYFTAWIDRQGRMNFREDIYGHDKKMMEKMFQ